jgi:glyoxylase-like metal-dependent hydrolase (beta-lactamase superfamily II)
MLIDSNSIPVSLFTGDTVFLGEVGKPDLAGSN